MTLQERADKIIHDAVKHGRAPIIICAWCPNALVKTEEAWRAGRQVSHGICPSCVLKFEEGSDGH